MNCHEKNTSGKKGHSLMMIICVLPIIILMGYLMLNNSADTGSSNPWLYLIILLCPLMHVFMMFGMKGHHEEQKTETKKE